MLHAQRAPVAALSHETNPTAVETVPHDATQGTRRNGNEPHLLRRVLFDGLCRKSAFTTQMVYSIRLVCSNRIQNRQK